MRGTPTSFWGKLELQEGKVTSWHPLDAHCADVAACCKALLERTLLRQRLARVAGWPELEAAHVDRLCFLAALHDLGKFNLGFQSKARPAERHRHRGHVRELLAIFGSEGEESARLAEVLGIEELEGWSEEDATLRLLIASVAHHGRPEPIEGRVEREIWRPEGRLDPWKGMRELVAAARQWFPEAFNLEVTPFPATAQFQHVFSGLVMLADWLGSHRRGFPYQEEGETDRFATALEAAHRMVEETGLASDRYRGTNPGITAFARISEHEPRSAQAVVAGLDLPTAGSVTILEAETGAGKTEAALARFVALFEARAVDGIYFALPTRTAATQIHRRVVDAVERAFPDPERRPPVTLAVPGYLRVDNQEGVRLPGFEVLWNDDERERWRFRGWAAEGPKRYLAGSVVVGTIDQVLLSCLLVPHAHLRSTALLRHLLVVDEVHASDQYMTRLLEHVVQRLVQTGGHAFLMSATLGTETRRRLLGARSSTTLSEAKGSPFPVVHLREGALECQIPVVGDRTDKEVELDLHPLLAESGRIAAMALAAARRGARVLVIRNTVKDCVATQVALEELVGPGEQDLLLRCAGGPVPHHARYARVDRIALDRAIEENVGKGVHRSAGVVAIATQTVQQSLDLDADLLISDLCPVDVLLQRIGRLHRHARGRPPGFERARVSVLVPPDRDLGALIQRKGDARGRWGFGTVYDDLRVLETTWRSIEREPVWRIPEMNRRLVEACTHPEALVAIVEELKGRWAAHATARAGALFAARGQAGLNLLDWTIPFPDLQFPSGSLDRRIASRLGESDRRIVFPEPMAGPFGAQVSELVLPAHLAGDSQADEIPTGFEPSSGGFQFQFGARMFRYDRLGLRVARGDEEDSDG